MAIRYAFRSGTGVLQSSLSAAIAKRHPALNVATVATRVVTGPPRPTLTSTVHTGVEAIPEDVDPLPSLSLPRARNAEEARSRLREGLEAAVAHAVGGARRVAVLTGGGLDSGALFALAERVARERGASAFAVALDFEGEGDDRPHLAALERHLRAEVVRVSPEQGARHFDAFERGIDASPCGWPTAPMELAMYEAARNAGAELVLNGMGGDEVFDGEPSTLAALVRRRPGEALRLASTLRGFGAPRSRVFSWIVRPIITEVTPVKLRRIRSRRRPLPVADWAGPVLVREARHLHWERIERVIAPERAAGPWRRPELHEPMAWHHHQMAIASRIESRRPYLEASLRALVDDFEPSWLLAGGVRRGLFREAVADLLPPSLVQRTDKAHFENANRRFFAAIGGLERVRPLASVTQLADLGIVEPRPFARAFEAFVRAADDEMGSTEVWPALAVESFLRHRAGEA